jgi:hypothetical protein
MIEYHNGHLATNVKDRNNYSHLHENYSQAEIDFAYEGCKEAFWDTYAPAVAEKYGYGKVFAEGRSDGWLVVDIEPFTKEEKSPEDEKAWEEFSREILAEMKFCCNERLTEVLKEITQHSS